MYKLILFLGICVAFASGSELPVPAEECGKIIGCYYTVELSEDSSGATIDIQNIDLSLCTHMFYSFIGLNEDASVQILDPYADYDGFKKFNDLRKKNPNLKTLALMGDSYDATQNNTNHKVLTDPTLREKLVNNILDFVKKYEFSGIDLDLSDPIPFVPTKKENFVLLLKALREKFDQEGLILSAAVEPTEETANILYDIKGISTYADFINLKTFDFHGISEAEKKIGVGHSSPLYPSSKENAVECKMNIDYVVKYWISQGAPPSKLILGSTFSGISYTLADPKQFGRGAPFIDEGKLGSQPEYYQVCTLAKDPQWNHFYDKEQQVPYIYNGNQIVAYDNVESIKAKAEYVEKMKLGGAMVFTINQDDHSGTCGEKFPLLKTFNQVLRNKC